MTRTITGTLAVLALAGCAARHEPPRGGPPPGGFGGGGERHGPLGGRGDGPGGGERSGHLFISPMGEPFRSEAPDRAWFDGADTDGDGRLTPAEFRADATRWFRLLDVHADGEIDPDDIERYETELAPEIRVGEGGGPGGGGRGDGGRRGGGGGRRGGGGMDGPGGGGGMGRGGGGMGGPGGGMHGGGGGSDGASAPAASRVGKQGAARWGYLDFPEPVTSADANMNRGVDLPEFLRAADARFRLLDKNGDGAITRGELPGIDTRHRGGPMPGGRPRPHGRDDEPAGDRAPYDGPGSEPPAGG